MTALQQIVAEYLENHGFDGLAFDDCGCGLGDFAPCGNGPLPECEPAMAITVPPDGELRIPRTGVLIEHASEPGDIVYVPATVL